MSAEGFIGPAQFEQALGIAAGKLPVHTAELLRSANLRYGKISAPEQAQLEAEAMDRIKQGFSVVGEAREGIWRDAWQDQLDRFEAANYAVSSLDPAFVDGSVVLRWQGEYVRSLSDKFELRMIEALRDALFRMFLSDVDSAFEFGSGSAFNVAAYCRAFPETPVCALDWAPAAVRIAELLREKLGMKVRGERFDFFAPDRNLALGNGAGVFTMCALEQVGPRFESFLQFLLEKRPRRVVHVEPTVELYDPTSGHDRVAIEYHTQRKYLVGLLPALRKLESEKKINMLMSRRLKFGSRYHECFSVHVWEPA